MVRLSRPNTDDLEKTRSGNLSYSGLIRGKKVAKGLWVGSSVDAANVDFMREHNISVVVNCTRDLPFRFPGQTHIRLGVDDAYSETLRLFELWKQAVPRISRYLDQGRHVLIHCFAGVQRSQGTVAALLMYREGISASEAIARCKRAKSDAFSPRIHFYRSLMRWQSWLKEHPPATMRPRSI